MLAGGIAGGFYVNWNFEGMNGFALLFGGLSGSLTGTLLGGILGSSIVFRFNRHIGTSKTKITGSAFSDPVINKKMNTVTAPQWLPFDIPIPHSRQRPAP